MGHPLMVDMSDPLLERLRGICLAHAGAGEKISHGRPNWYTQKVFASFGGSVRGDSGNRLLARALLFLPDPDDACALDEDPRIHVPAYVGHRGWRALPLDVDEPDWDEVAELVDASYRQLAPSRLLGPPDPA